MIFQLIQQNVQEEGKLEATKTVCLNRDRGRERMKEGIRRKAMEGGKRTIQVHYHKIEARGQGLALWAQLLGDSSMPSWSNSLSPSSSVFHPASC